MARTMLLTTTVLMCLVVAVGCDRAREAAPEAPMVQGKTVIWLPGRAAKAARRESAAEQARPMSTPSPDEASEAPTSDPPPPPPAKPPRPRAPHTDRCGRPLVT